MAQTRLNLTYALKDGVITHISEVDRGLKCECICPACGDKLIARKGQRVMHHFAHQSTEHCEYGYETSLHLAAKAILSQAKKMIIPPVYVCFPNSCKDDLLVSEAREIEFDRVKLEQWLNNIVPDVAIYVGKKKFLVEIFVTYYIDEEKLDKLKAADISTIEIDLSRIDSSISKEALTDLLTQNSAFKYWKYNSVANRYLKKFYIVADKRTIIRRDSGCYIDGCPIAALYWNGKPYANCFEDCLFCAYCIDYSGDNENFILCSGRQRISSLQDFRTPEEICIRPSTNTLIAQKRALIKRSFCPNCDGRLIQRQGKYGKFLGCNQYPFCRFTASVDSL